MEKKTSACSHLCVSDITDVTLVGHEVEVCGENGLLGEYEEVEYEVEGYEVKGAFGQKPMGAFGVYTRLSWGKSLMMQQIAQLCLLAEKSITAITEIS